MKKLLVISSLAVSMSVMTPVYAEATSSGAAATVTGAVEAVVDGAVVATEVVVEGAAAAAGTAGVGAVVIGAGAGLGTAYVMNDKLFTPGVGELCSEDKKTASCNAAQAGTWTGAGIGIAGVGAALATCGADAAGLAAMGGMLGGGLATGVATIVITPVVLAAAGGYAAYHWWPTDLSLPSWLGGDAPAAATEETQQGDNTTAEQAE